MHQSFFYVEILSINPGFYHQIYHNVRLTHGLGVRGSSIQFRDRGFRYHNPLIPETLHQSKDAPVLPPRAYHLNHRKILLLLSGFGRKERSDTFFCRSSTGVGPSLESGLGFRRSWNENPRVVGLDTLYLHTTNLVSPMP